MRGAKSRPSLVVWGCGGHGRVVLDAARATGSFRRIAFYDDDESFAGGRVCDAEVFGGGIDRVIGLGFVNVVVAIGRNDVREKCWAKARAAGGAPSICFHPTSWTSPFATIGEGSVVLAGAIVQNGAVVGVDCIVNTAAVLEHDVRVGDHVHVSPGAVICGGAEVGAGAHVGAGSVVLPGVRIGERSIVGAGAVVRVDVPCGATVAGVPARRIRGGE